MKLDPERLRTLSTVLRTGSFEAAAKEMGITQSAVSQRIKHLEEMIGSRLVLREIPCIGTEAGLRLAAHADQVETLEKILARELGHKVGDNPVPISLAANVDTLSSWFFDAVNMNHNFLFDFRVDHPEFTDALLESGQVVGAITNTPKAIAGCDCHALGEMVYLPVASPAFVKKYFSAGVTLETLSKAPLIRYNQKDLVWHSWIEQQFGASISPPIHSLPSETGFLKMMRAGLGWGMEHVEAVESDIQTGQLVPLIENSNQRMPLYWQNSRIWRNTIADLTKSICQTARTKLPQS
jgi:LysR family transcriptional regulator (chromosome initiation inhibitor)